MNAHKANLINAVSLILISLWIYYDAINPNIIMLFPLLIGVVLLSLNNGVLYGYKEQIYASVFLTFFGILLVTWLFYKAYLNDDMNAMLTNGLIFTTGILSALYLIKERIVSAKKK